MSPAPSARAPAPAPGGPDAALDTPGGPEGPNTPQNTPQGWVLPAPAAEATRIFGLAPPERLRRALARAGCRSVRSVTPEALPPADAPVVVLRGDVVLDERLVQGLVELPGALLVCDGLGPVAAHAAPDEAARVAAALARGGEPTDTTLRRCAPGDLAPAYVAKLRKREPPFVFEARPDVARDAEERLFDASYKGLTDLVTKWVWPRPALAATRWCAARGVRPNTVTLWSWVLAALAAWLFLEGAFLAGLAAAWLMTFLDTVDGKLARVTLTSSRLGDVLDHGLDLLHPPFWWLAWGLGLGAGHAPETAIVVGGYLVGRALEGAFLAAFGFETHSWRALDGLFRTITARRNPNLILLSVGTLVGRPDLGFALVAGWTLASLAFHAVRLAQAFALRRRGGAVLPWEGA